jgi:protein regulator of cytokinesis 1
MSEPRRQSYILKQFGSIDGRLQGLFDELGLSLEEKHHREKQLYSVIETALEEQVKAVGQERDDLVYKCQDLQYNLGLMVYALKDVNLEENENTRGVNQLIEEHEIRPPYKQKAEKLESISEHVEEIYSERLMRINRILEVLKDLSTRVDDLAVPAELMPAKDDNPQNLDLSNSRIAQLDEEITRWQQVYNERLATVSDYATHIVALWAELGTPQDEIDRKILSNYKSSPEQLGTLSKDIEELKNRYSDLENEKSIREQKLANYKKQIKHLWNKLNEDEEVQRQFERRHVGLAQGVLDAHEKELDRLNEKKREYIHVFINDSRDTLHELWKKLYFSEDEKFQFTPAWTEVYTDASLDAHETEIERLEKLLEERKPVLRLIDEYYKLKQEAEELEASTHDSSRLLAKGSGQKRDPSRLLREEQMRKRLAKRKPKIIQEVESLLHGWEDRNSLPFMVNGTRFLDVLAEENKRKPPSSSLRRAKSTKEMATKDNHKPSASASASNRSVSASAIRSQTHFGNGRSAAARPGAVSTSPIKAQRGRLSPTKEGGGRLSPTKEGGGGAKKLGLKTPKPTAGRQHQHNVTDQTPVNHHKKNNVSNTNSSVLRAGPQSQQSLRVPSNTTHASTGSTTSSENWEVYDDASSSEDEIVDGSYMRWRQEAMKNLGSQDYQVRRVSEFNWDKDVF